MDIGSNIIYYMLLDFIVNFFAEVLIHLFKIRNEDTTKDKRVIDLSKNMSKYNLGDLITYSDLFQTILR